MYLPIPVCVCVCVCVIVLKCVKGTPYIHPTEECKDVECVTTMSRTVDVLVISWTAD